MKIKQTLDFDEWLSELVRISLPFEIQRKVVNCETLSRDELDTFSSTIMLAAQARQVRQADAAAETLSSLGRKVDRILDMSRKQLKNERAILWYTSSNDPKFKPADGRETSAIRHVMVQYALKLLEDDITLSERSAANIVITRFKGVDGAYGTNELETFRRHINRTNPLK